MSAISHGARFAVIGVGASAGGLAAMEELFGSLGVTPHAAWVIVTHLQPDRASKLTELLTRMSPMPVAEITTAMALEPGRVYVAPPAVYVALAGGRFETSEPPGTDRHHPIDFFFRSLATYRGAEAACVILSGSGSDGAFGLRSIKEGLGLTLVQDPAEAEFDGMPWSSINTGLADDVLPIAELAALLLTSLAANDKAVDEADVAEADSGAGLRGILTLLQAHTGHDFTLYRTNTIRRRLQRRMLVRRIDHLKQYEGFLKESPEELDLLLRDLLIGVTHFFRDPEAYGALSLAVSEMLASDGATQRPVRAWVAGCATGEEAYSVAIILLEALERAGSRRSVQVFATDINEDAIAAARAGYYPAGIALDVNPERLNRYFVPENEGFRIRAAVRRLVVFAVHSLVKDPPFNRIDLACCRNVLIYMERELQDRVLSTMAYSLEPRGLLFLGASEGLGTSLDMFAPDESGFRVHRRLAQTLPQRPIANWPALGGRLRQPIPGHERQGDFISTVRRIIETIMPPAVVIDANGDVLYVVGHTGAFLELPPGASTNNLYRLVKSGLQHELLTLVRRAEAERTEVTQEVDMKYDGQMGRVLLRVRRLTDGERQVYLVIFDRGGAVAASSPDGAVPVASQEYGDAEEVWTELIRTRDALGATVEDLEASVEELGAANEEFVSTNEELQSTNEELETSREELQSLNEELQIVNGELDLSNQALMETNADLHNLLDSTGIATLFLDKALRIKRFTQPVADLFNLLPTDINRPVGDLATNLRYHDLVADAEEVLASLEPKHVEVQRNDDHWFALRMMPRRGADNALAGLVLTFSDIDAQKQEQRTILDVRRFAEAMTTAIPLPLVVLDGDLCVVSASESFCLLVQQDERSLSHQPLDQVQGFHGIARDPRLQTVLATDAASSKGFEMSPWIAGTDGISVQVCAIATLPEAPLWLLVLAKKDGTKK